ncbi:RDD family protein [Salinisphaera sp. SPP-AMP-43]|uniref:RDD family protein n=1 Tax=Salinisphaera sp. SPP-AMP-43 TaxID=3121288 RepID=UPI003C6DEA88
MIYSEARFCSECGAAHARAEDASVVRRDIYASIWRRGGAALIDMLISTPLLLLLNSVAYLRGHGAFVDVGILILLSRWTQMLISTSYYALFEGSAMRATPGKYLLGLAVVDNNGDRLTWGQAFGREFAKWLSCLILMIGIFMIAVTRRRQGLHDKLAGTRVVYREVEPPLVMADPVAPRPNVLSVIAAFCLTVGLLALPVFGALLIASPGRILGQYQREQQQSGHSNPHAQQVVAKARDQIYNLKIESAQAIESVFDYVDAHYRWPDTLAEAGFHNGKPETTRLVYDADLKQVTAFARAAPLQGGSLQRRVTSTTIAGATRNYDTVCVSPNIPPKLLPHGCKPR